MVYSYYSIITTTFLNFFCAYSDYLRYNKRENTNGGSDNMHIEEFDNVLLKNGQTAAIIAKIRL